MLRLASWLLLLTTAALLFASVWIVVPVPEAWLLPLGVGAPEVSPVLLAASLLLAPVAAVRARRSGVARLALVLVLVSAGLSVVPIVQIPSTLARFDAALKSTRGAETSNMRAEAVILRELFRPVEPGDVRVSRGIEFARPDGVPLKLDIYRPRGQGHFPVLIQIYGGSWQ
ncbi:MAG: hypothetical protein ND807_10650, partial [Vicinamibacterales bacterium]|nr:hypothetical protein [Vicinamibacterales bacterium]